MKLIYNRGWTCARPRRTGSSRPDSRADTGVTGGGGVTGQRLGHRTRFRDRQGRCTAI